MDRSGRATNPTEPAAELAWQQWEPSHPRSPQADGVPLLLINGLGSPMTAFEVGFIELLVDRGFSVVRFDNRDVGASSRTPGDRPTARRDAGAKYTIADQARDAVAVLDDVGWATAHVFGQSMGGMIAQQVAIDHPTRVRSVTSLMSSTGRRGLEPPDTPVMNALLTPAPAERSAWLDWRVETEALWASPAHWDPDWVRAKGELMYDHGVDSGGAARQYRAIAEGPNRDDQLRLVDRPFLVIHGSADTLVRPEAGRHTAEVVPGARYVEIEGMGHDLPPPLWPRLVDELSTFVGRIDSGLG